MQLTLPAALASLKNLPAVRDLPVILDDNFLNRLLTLSAGVNAQAETVYRVYYVAAKFLEQIRSQHTLSSADGAVFTGLAIPIASLLNLQFSEDLALGLIIPPGFESVPISIASHRVKVFGTKSVRVRPVL